MEIGDDRSDESRRNFHQRFESIEVYPKDELVCKKKTYKSMEFYMILIYSNDIKFYETLSKLFLYLEIVFI